VAKSEGSFTFIILFLTSQCDASVSKIFQDPFSPQNAALLERRQELLRISTAAEGTLAALEGADGGGARLVSLVGFWT